MKKRFYIITTFILSAAVLTMSACLKDPRAQDFSNVGTLIELPIEAYNGIGTLIPEALPIQTTAQNVALVVNVASPKALSSSLTVTLTLDQAALATYNQPIITQWKADSAAAAAAGNPIPAGPNVYTLPPANAYSIPSFKVTIPAGQHTASLNISVISSNLDPAGLYVIPLTITDGGGQKISNYKTALLNVQAKNKYDGLYSLKGYIHRDADLTLGGPISGVTSALATAGANSLYFTQVWASGSETGGVNPIVLAIDPTTNAITITSLANPLLHNLPSYNSHYDPATQTLYLGLIWNGADPNHRSAIDTLTYLKPRP